MIEFIFFIDIAKAYIRSVISIFLGIFNVGRLADIHLSGLVI
jgi:hypothetical protein